MKIQHDQEEVFMNTIEPGQCFQWGDGFFARAKIAEEDFRTGSMTAKIDMVVCFDLQCGTLSVCSPCIKVVPLEAKISLTRISE